MAITNGYCTLDQIKDRLADASATWTGADDDALENVIEACSRWVDNRCGRRFFTASETRYYTADHHRYVYIDDVVSVSELATDDNADRTYSTTWLSTDYDLKPYNAQLAQPPRPYTSIETAPDGDEAFPRVRKGVKLTGSFGYCTTANQPVDITEAVLLLSMRLWRRKDAIFGVAGAPALGVQVIQAKITADADIMALLSPYKRSYL